MKCLCVKFTVSKKTALFFIQTCVYRRKKLSFVFCLRQIEFIKHFDWQFIVHSSIYGNIKFLFTLVLSSFRRQKRAESLLVKFNEFHLMKKNNNSFRLHTLIWIKERAVFCDTANVAHKQLASLKPPSFSKNGHT